MIDNDTLVKFLKQICDDVNKQLYAANHYEEFECAPLNTSVDIVEQKHHEHKKKFDHARIANAASKHVQEKFTELSRQHDVSTLLASPAKKAEFRSQVINEVWQYFKKLKAGSDLLNMPCPSFDEFIKFVSDNIDEAIDSLLKNQPLFPECQPYLERLKKEDELVSQRIRFENETGIRFLRCIDFKDADLTTTLILGNFLDRTKATVGFCGENAALSIVRILNALGDHIQQIEQIVINYLEDPLSRINHAFLAINRDKDSNLNDISSWGENAILYDSWNGLVCKAKDFNALPKRYFSYTPGTQCAGVWHGAKWTSYPVLPSGKHVLEYIQKEDILYQITGNSELNTRESNIIDEYQLFSLQDPKLVNTKQLVFNILNNLGSNYLANDVQLFVTTAGNRLIKHIPGLTSPTVAIHKSLLLGLKTGIFTVDELAFALVQGLLQAKQFPVQFRQWLAISDQHFIDWQAVRACENSASAISYLQKAHQFKKSWKADNAFPKYFTNFRDESCRFGERIKLLNTKFAQMNYQMIAQFADLDSQVQAAVSEIEDVEKPAYFNDATYRECQTTLEKINNLKLKIPELKRELIPFEVTHKASVRLREYCQLLQNLEIDLSQRELAESVDALLIDAFELKIPGFDLIYKILSGDIARYAKLKILGPFKQYQAVIDEFLVANDCATALEAAKKIQNFRKVFKSHFAWNIITEDLSYGMLLERKERLFGSTVGNYVMWRSFQNKYKILVEKELPKELSSNCYLFIDQKGKYALYFIDDAKKLLPIDMNEIKDLIKISHPKIKLGRQLKIKECIASYLYEQNKSLPWDQHVNWAKEDTSGIIIRTLWHLGVIRDQRLWNHFTSNEIAFIISCPRDEYILSLLELKGELSLFSEKRDYGRVSEKLSFRMSAEHTMNTQMFETNLDFETAFIQFYDTNIIGLVWGPPTLNRETESVLFLLDKFKEIIKKETTQEKEFVRSFFLGRKDQKDLAHLEARTNCYTIESESPYIKFFMSYCKPNMLSPFFTLDDFLTLFRKRHFEKGLGQVEYLLSVLQNPGDDLWNAMSLTNLEDIVAKLFKYDLGNVLPVIKHYLKINAKSPLLSHEAATIFRLILEKGGFILPKYMKKILKAFTGSLPISADQVVGISCEDLISIYQYLETTLSFPSFSHQEVLGSIILKKLQLMDVENQVKILNSLILKKENSAISNVRYRNNIFKLYISCILKKYGKDKKEEEQSKELTKIISTIFSDARERDVAYLLSEMSNAIETQNKLSTYIGQRIDPEKYFLIREKNYSRNANFVRLFSFLASKKENQIQILNFLSSHITQQTLDTFATYLMATDQGLSIIHLFLGTGGTHQKPTLEWVLQLIYNQFWSHTLEERSVLIDFLLIPANQVLDEEKYKLAFNDAFDFVAQKLFPNFSANPLDDENLAVSFLKAYLNTADKYRRNYFLAGLLVTTNEVNTEKKANIGRKLATLSENLGPLYVKITQGIHSYQYTPPEIRDELAHIKGRANPPKRWDLWRLIDDVVPFIEQEKIARVGKLLGSASFNLALEVHLRDGRDVVLLLLRENAKNDTQNGFEHLRAAISACHHERMEKIRSTTLSLIDEAYQLSFAEMNPDCGDLQDKIAQQLYGSLKDVQVDGYNISVSSSKTLSSGPGYRFITRVYGTEYNDLPERTKSQQAIKKAVAKVIMQIELGNMLRGDHFDCDRHGNQLRITADHNRKEITIGLYDFGEMSLTKPTDEDMKQLKGFLETIIFSLFQRKHIATELSVYIDKELKLGKPVQYLMRIRKGLLALQDFQKYLSNYELYEILNTLSAQKQIHPVIKEDFSTNLWIAAGYFSLYKAKRKIEQTVGYFARFFYNKDEMDTSEHKDEMDTSESTSNNNNSESLTKQPRYT